MEDKQGALVGLLSCCAIGVIALVVFAFGGGM